MFFAEEQKLCKVVVKNRQHRQCSGGGADDYQGGRKREKWAAVCSLPGWRLHGASVQLLKAQLVQPTVKNLRCDTQLVTPLKDATLKNAAIRSR